MPNRSLRILILSNFYAYVTNANVIRDFLFSFKDYSKHDCYYIYNCNNLNAGTNFSPFDVIILFWDIYLIGNSLKPAVIEKIRKAPALKVLFLQDEYREVRQFNEMMAKLGVNVMCTCVAEPDHDLFYPPTLIPSLQATYTVLTGYIPAYLEAALPDITTPRALDIGYRSRAVPYWLGALGQEKRIIAEQFQLISDEYGLRSDISVREQDRIYGDKWVEFLKTARFTLGTGSGSSVVDFTGEIRQNCEAYLHKNPQANYEELKSRFFADVDGKVVIDTISPRFFETTACGNILILHEAPYAGILIPDYHYIPVKKDYSNIDEVITKIKDMAYCRQLGKNAYEDLIGSGKYNYRAFVSWFDEMLAQHVARRVTAAYMTPDEFQERQETLLKYSHLYAQIFTPFGTIRIPHPYQVSRMLLKPIYTRISERFPRLVRLRQQRLTFGLVLDILRRTALKILSISPGLYQRVRSIWRSPVIVKIRQQINSWLNR